MEKIKAQQPSTNSKDMEEILERSALKKIIFDIEKKMGAKEAIVKTHAEKAERKIDAFKAKMAEMSSRFGEVGSSPVHNVHGKSVAIYGTKPTKLQMERAATEQTAREAPWPDVAAMVGSETVEGLINGTLGKLELKGGKIGDVGVITLAKVLAQCSSLKELILDENDITDACVTTLFQVLPQCDSLWKVSLSSNRIGDAGAVAAADILVQCEDSPIHLYLSSNEIGDPGAVALMNVLPKSALTCINLGSNQISASVKSELSKMSSGVEMDGSAPVSNKNGQKILIWP